MTRWQLYLDWVLSHFVKKELKKELRFLFWMTLYQVFFMHKAFYHVVDEVVESVKAEKGQGTANFFNAVLRRSIRERDSLALPDDPASHLSVEYSFPLWLVKRWMARLGRKDTASLLNTLNQSPEFGLRVDTGRITTAQAKQRLLDAGIDAREGRFVDGSLHVDRIGPLLANPLFADRLVLVQDETSQMAALALEARPGQLILDACAGQGTKTGQIAEASPEARLVAMDVDRTKLRTLGPPALKVQADALKIPFKKATFDSILLDAPCSSLGIIRKHPEIKWRRSQTDIVRNGAMQRQMVRALSASLKSGGRLVYSVCSFEPEETLDVVNEIVAEGSLEFDGRVPGASGSPWFLSLPHVTGLDGFFIAALKKP